MARTHTMTPARRAALKRAQAASARKRRGKGKGKLAAANRKLDGRVSRRRVVGNIALVGAMFAASGAHIAYKVRQENISAHKKHSKNIRARGITRALYSHRGGRTTVLGQRPSR